MQELEATALEQLERFERLLPWEQISEEDFFWVNGFYISIRGNTRKPAGAYFCPNQKLAETLVFKPKAPVPASVWGLNLVTKELQNSDGKGNWTPLALPDQKKLAAALKRAMDVYEDKTDAGVKFPITFNLDDDY